VDSGYFAIVVQGVVATDPLSFSSSNSAISSALTAASSQLSYATRECLYYGVTKSLSTNGKDLQIKVQFNVDNSKPLTMLDLFYGDLIGLLLNLYTMISF